MTELRKRKNNDVGFIDPNVVFKHPNPPPQWKAELEKNLMRFLVNQQKVLSEPTKQKHTLPLQL